MIDSSMRTLRPGTPTTFGTAGWLSLRDAQKRLLTQRGDGAKLCPYVGALFDPNNNDTWASLYARRADQSSEQARRIQELREGSGHLITFAPTRAGKGTSQIIPNLISWRGSAIVIDVKGENYKLSAGYRKEKLGQRVIRFAPFEDEGECWNPIMCIRANPDATNPTSEEEEDARYLTNLLIAPSGSKEDQFWENSAKNFLEGLILHVRTSLLIGAEELEKYSDIEDEEPEFEAMLRERSMQEVRRLLALNKDSFTSLLDAMMGSNRPIVKQAGSIMARLRGEAGKTAESILSVAMEQTSVWAYSRLRRSTYIPKNTSNNEPGENDFEFSDLRDSNTTLYIIVPPEYLAEYRRVLRVLIGMAMRELKNTYKQAVKDQPPVLFMLDEFPQLGYMQPIEESLLYLAGYGIRFWFFVQDLSQLKQHYPKTWRTFMANTGTQCFYGVSDIETAKLVSEMAGTATVLNRSFGMSESESETQGGQTSHSDGKQSGSGFGRDGWSSNSGRNQSITSGTSWSSTTGLTRSANAAFVGRRIIMPDEVLRMHDQEQIIFMKGLRPICASRPPYFYLKDQREKTEIKPPHDVDFD